LTGLAIFLDILTKVTLPIIALVALGWAMQPRLKLDVGSLNRLQVNVILPCFFLFTLSTSKQPLSAVWPTATFMLIQLLLLIPLGWLIAIVFRMKPETGPVVGLGMAYANVGFFGVPVTLLAFGPDYLIHVSIMAVFMAVMAVSVGVWLLAPGGTGLFSKLRTAFDTPMIPAIALGLVLRGLEMKLPPLVEQPVQMMGQTFTALALYSLGAQIAATPLKNVRFGPQLLMVVLKFGVAPALTWALALYLELPRDLVDMLVVLTASPVGVIITIYCIEYDRDPDFIASAVVITTALSPIFVSGWILLTRLY
jgi:malate permease and related proteins